MLDPEGRKEVLKTVQRLREKKKVTVILITHYMEEVIDADKVYVMDHGRVVITPVSHKPCLGCIYNSDVLL